MATSISILTRSIAVRRLAALALCATTMSPSLRAQVRASERATVSQTADGTVFTINYSRPQARGRTVLFGKSVHWGEVWTPGANWATTLDVNRDVTINGRAVAKGKYSVWFIVQPREWTVVLDPRFQRYHTEAPDSTAEQIRWVVRPTEGTFSEVLTWSFPTVRPDGVEMLFAWGTKRVKLNAAVRPTHPITIASQAAKPFVGRYLWKWAEDSLKTATDTMELYFANDTLRQRHAPFPNWYPSLQNQPMVRINDDWFIPTIIRNGRVWEMVADMVYEFTLQDGVAVSFEIRDDKDILIGGGKRIGVK